MRLVGQAAFVIGVAITSVEGFRWSDVRAGLARNVQGPREM